jgi:NAD(P)H-dependent flavin oxidoreductase YrpB (nitropropane dioxygenase family)
MARQAVGAMRHLKAINEGDIEEGILFASQGIGGIRDLPSVQELVDRMIKEAEEAMEQVKKTRK